MKRGAALLEVVVCLFLFAAVGILLMNLYPTALLGMHGNQARLQAGNLAGSALAEVRQRPFNSLAAGTRETLGETTVDDIAFVTELSIETPPAGDPARLRVLRVTTRWNGGEVSREVWVTRVHR